MQTFHIDEMTGGWFVGDFAPTCIRAKEVEVACKSYRTGDNEARHVHKVALESTLIVSGKARMNGMLFRAGDIVLLAPGEASDFQALEDTVTVVVKMPSIVGDKHLVAHNPG